MSNVGTNRPKPGRSNEVRGPAAQNPGDDARPGTPGTGQNVCPECGGSGRRDGSVCQNCAGSGRVTEGIGGA